MELEEIKSLLSQKTNELGYELVSFNYINKGKDDFLNIVVDRVAAIDMNDIVELSNHLSLYLDEIDAFDSPYTLDVSSLGIEKPLKIDQLPSYINSYIHVHLINPIDGENIYEGILESVNQDSFVLSIKIKTREKKLNILFNNIYKIRLAIKF